MPAENIRKACILESNAARKKEKDIVWVTCSAIYNGQGYKRVARQEGGCSANVKSSGNL